LDWDKIWKYYPLLLILPTEFFVRNPLEKINTKISSLLFDSDKSCITCGNKLANYKDITPRILFALQKTDIPPGGVPDKWTDGANETANFSLFYPWEKGLYNKFWKNYIQFRINTKLVKITKQMDFTELQNFDFSRKYMINGTKYLVKDIQVVLKKDSIMPAILGCYPCP
jgi:hypothetical protein